MCFFISENETAASNAFVNDCVGELVGSGKTVLTLFDPDPFFEGEFEFRPLFVLEPFGVLSLSSASVPGVALESRLFLSILPEMVGLQQINCGVFLQLTTCNETLTRKAAAFSWKGFIRV